MSKVCILLSTYNGQKYIREQLESLLKQKDVELQIIVRDDGSTDDTCGIIEKEYPMVELRRETNIGCEPSFMELLHTAPNDADFYAFCDQDDVWMEDKLITAVKALGKFSIPALYGCNLMVCDEKLNPQNVIHTEKGIESAKRKFKRDYLGNMHGCVLVWNRTLQEKIKMYRPEYITSHDTWVNSIGNAIGTMVVDKEPHILYRLHGDNVAGYAQGGIERLKKGLKRYIGKGHPERDRLAKEILKGYADFMDKDSEGYYEIECLAGYKKNIGAKVKLMKCNIIKDTGFFDRAFWRVCILLGTY